MYSLYVTPYTPLTTLYESVVIRWLFSVHFIRVKTWGLHRQRRKTFQFKLFIKFLSREPRYLFECSKQPRSRLDEKGIERKTVKQKTLTLLLHSFIFCYKFFQCRIFYLRNASTVLNLRNWTEKQGFSTKMHRQILRIL